MLQGRMRCPRCARQLFAGGLDDDERWCIACGPIIVNPTPPPEASPKYSKAELMELIEQWLATEEISSVAVANRLGLKVETARTVMRALARNGKAHYVKGRGIWRRAAGS